MTETTETTRAEKTRETRLRRMALRQGLVLRKSRRRDPRALDHGRYWLTWYGPTTASTTYGQTFGGTRGWTLDEVEAFLTADPPRYGILDGVN